MTRPVVVVDVVGLTPKLLAHMPALRPSLRWTCALTGAGVAVLGWCWLRTRLPLVAGDWLGGYEPALDASNDYYVWEPEKQLLEEAVADVQERTGQMPIVIGPHWSVCAQAEVALAGRVHVGCDSVERDDYDDWSSPARWDAARTSSACWPLTLTASSPVAAGAR